MQQLIKDTQQGPVKGKLVSKHYLWAGVPFAAPITNETRFKVAASAVARTEILDCTSFRSSAIQCSPSPHSPIEESDDCLFLNIYAPTEPLSEKLPVIIWIHGGGYMAGAGAGYSGAKLCEEQGLVVVTINYRLTVCGFTNWNSIINDPKKRFEDNVGIKDQAKALEWVHYNIANFGGDPKRVTIAGESAGGSSVVMLLTNPDSRGYYHQAVIQSCSPSVMDEREVSRIKALHVAQYVLSSILPILSEEDRGIVKRAIAMKDYTHPRIADIIIDTPTRKMHDGIAQGVAATEGRIPYGAWFDGQTFPNSRHKAVDAMPTNIKVVIGHNKDESSLWSELLQVPGEPEQLPISRRSLQPILDKLPKATSAAIQKCYDLSTPDGWLDLSSDIIFINATRRLALDMAKRGIVVYRYRLDKFSEIGRWSDCVPHTVELLAFWGVPFVESFVDSQLDMSEKCRQLLKVMQDCWGAFIRQGDPGWPAYNPHTHIVASFDCLAPASMKEITSFQSPKELPEKVAAWRAYELCV